MTFEEAYRKILSEGLDIEAVPNSEYLYEIEINGSYKVMTDQEVIEFAENL
jgi:hypothetical protein